MTQKGGEKEEDQLGISGITKQHSVKSLCFLFTIYPLLGLRESSNLEVMECAGKN